MCFGTILNLIELPSTTTQEKIIYKDSSEWKNSVKYYYLYHCSHSSWTSLMYNLKLTLEQCKNVLNISMLVHNFLFSGKKQTCETLSLK